MRGGFGVINKVELKLGTFKIDELKPGQIQRWGERYYLACPRCGMGLSLNHTVTINKFNEVTIDPSVGHPACKMHIYVRNSYIRYLPDL